MAASELNATSAGGVLVTGGDANELVLKTGGTAAITIDGSQNVAVAGTFTFDGGSEPTTTGKAIAMSIVFG